MAADMKRQQEKQAIREILHEQIQMDQLKRQIDKEDIQEPTETHFGPEEDKKVSIQLINRKREMQNLVNAELQKQIGYKHKTMVRKMEKEKLTDAVNMGAVNSKLLNEKMEKMENRKNQRSEHRDAWSNQIAQNENERAVDAIARGAVF